MNIGKVKLMFVICFVSKVLPETSTFSLSTHKMYYAELKDKDIIDLAIEECTNNDKDHH